MSTSATQGGHKYPVFAQHVAYLLLNSF